jgi:hypothetical protein
MVTRGTLGPQIDATANAAKMLQDIGGLLYNYCLDEVPLPDEARLTYEARSTHSCSECACLYVSTKDGMVCRIPLNDGKRIDKKELGRCARTLLHVHRPPTVWKGKHPCLLIGTDDGQIHIFEERDEQLCAVGVWPNIGEPAGKNRGITALAFMSRDESADGTRLLAAASRNGLLFVLDPVTGFSLHLRREISLRGWNQWLLNTPTGLVCVSRQGESVRLTRRTLFGDGPEMAEEPAWRSLGVQPIALARLKSLQAESSLSPDGILCLGTANGVTFRETSRQLHAPPTHSPVLCLAEAQLHDRDYLAIGLDSGKVVIVQKEMLAGEMTDEDEAKRPRQFSVTLGSAVLGMELLSVSDHNADTAACFLFVALRNHALKLYRIRNHTKWRGKALHLWMSLHGFDGSIDYSRAVTAVIASLRNEYAHRHDHVRYLLLDAVLPEIAAVRPLNVPADRLAEAVRLLTGGGGRKVLQALSSRLSQYFRTGDIDAIIEASMNLLDSTPRHPNRLWKSFVERHLDHLRLMMGRLEDPVERARITAWMRFVRKYVLLGHTFSGKVENLENLVDCNNNTRKYFDAFIYKVLLYHRRHNIDWQVHLSDEPAFIHLDSDTCIVTVITANATVRFFDRADGRSLAIKDPRGARLECLPCSGREKFPRTLAACAFSRPAANGVWDVRAIVSWLPTSPGSAGVTVHELQWVDGELHLVRTTEADKGAFGQREEVHSLVCVSAEDDAVLAGLSTTDSPLAALSCTERGWQLVPLATPQEEVASTRARSRRQPTRALAVARRTSGGPDVTEFVATFGGEDGRLHLARVHVSKGLLSCEHRVGDSIRLFSSITAVEIDGSDQVFAATGDGALYAFAIRQEDSTSGAAAKVRIDSAPVWRDVHETPLRKLRIMRGGLYDGRPTLLGIAGDGHVSFYEITAPQIPSLTESGDYLHQGLRHDRVRLRGQLRAFHMSGQGSEFASIEGGWITKGAFRHLRNSRGREEQFDELTELFEKVILHEEIFRRPLNDQGVRLFRNTHLRRIAELADIEGGALRRYLVRLRFPAAESLDAEAIVSAVEDVLRSLRPDISEDREWIKAILKNLVRFQLFRDSGDNSATMTAQEHARVVTITRFVTRYILNDLASTPRPGAQRVQAVVMRELLRGNMLRHVAQEGRNGATVVRDEVTRGIEHCLSQEERILRVEVLRALGVALRNTWVDVNQRPKDQREQRRRLSYPRGFQDANWILELVLGQLRKYHPIVRSGYLPATAWTSLWVLAQIIQVFPEHALVVCHKIVEETGDSEPLRIMYQCIEGDADETRQRIRLYESLCSDGQAQFVSDFEAQAFHRRVLQCGMSPPGEHAPSAGMRLAIDDNVLVTEISMACQLIRDLWGTQGPEDLRAAAFRYTSLTLPANAVFLGPTFDWLARFCSVLQNHERLSPQELATRIAELVPGDSVSAPWTFLLDQLRAWWSVLTTTKRIPPQKGSTVCGRELGDALSEKPLASVYSVPGDREVVKVFCLMGTGPAIDPWRRQFLKSLDVMRSLHGIDEVVRIHDTDGDTLFPAFVMERCSLGPLRKFVPRFCDDKGLDRVIVAQRLAASLSRGLHQVHNRGVRHRDIYDENILVHAETPEVTEHSILFKLCDFSVAAERRAPGQVTHEIGEAKSRVPAILNGRALVESGSRAVANDLHMLGAVVYWTLTGERIAEGATPADLTDAVARIRQIENRRLSDSRKDFFEALVQLLDPTVTTVPFASAADFHKQVTEEALPRAAIPVVVIETRGKTVTVLTINRSSTTRERAKCQVARISTLVNSLEQGGKQFVRGHARNQGLITVWGEELGKALQKEALGVLMNVYRTHDYMHLLLDDEDNTALPWELLYVPDVRKTLGELFWTVRCCQTQQPSLRHQLIRTARTICFEHRYRKQLKPLAATFGTEGYFDVVDSVDAVARALNGDPVDLLHVFGHCEPSVGFCPQDQIQAARVGDAPRLDNYTIKGLSEESQLTTVGKNTIVLLNGCHTAGMKFERDLSRAFLGCGALAVVATCLPVRSDEAVAATRFLFDQWQGDGMPLVQAVSKLRANLRLARETRLAYVLYAPPTLTVSYQHEGLQDE